MRTTFCLLSALLGTSLLFGLAGPAFGKHDDDDRPKVTPQAAADVTTTAASLRAQVITGDDDARYRFQYGTTTAYGTATSWGRLRERQAPYPVTGAIAGLQPSTTYHFRVVATDEDGDNVTYGESLSFTTAATPIPAPVVGPAPVGAELPVGPQIGKTLGVAPRGGSVKVKRPGSHAAVPLKAGEVVPVGSLVDASNGSLSLTSQLPSGETQSGEFRGGSFTARQGRGGYVDLYLRGPVCGRSPKKAKSGASASASRKRRGRRLFGRDRGGRFRTHGRNSHATVRGTRWVVEDTCRGTLTKVTEGAVVVADKVKKKRVLVKAGGRYLARPRR